MSAPIKIDIYTIFFIPLIFIFRIFALILDKLLRNGCVRWLTDFRFILLLVIYWVLSSWYSIRIYDGVNECEDYLEFRLIPCFFENYWWCPQIELMNAISNLTCIPIAKLHNTVTGNLWLFTRIIARIENF